MKGQNKTQEQVKEYYGKVLKTQGDLKTGACCSAETLPVFLKEVAAELHPEVTEKFYGCGSPIPFVLEGSTVLDLGCGTGRDSYLLSKLAGPEGRVIGVDMTEEQLEVARRHLPYHTEKFGFSGPNVEFHLGYIEDLGAIGIANESVDLVVSNCVINLSEEKFRIFSEIFRVLKPGGELLFSDVFADRRIPFDLAHDPVLRGECLGGAMYVEDFRRMMARLGCLDYRLVSGSPIPIKDPQIEGKVGGIRFSSLTIRAFKLPLEDRCEDYGQVAYYLGTIPEAPHFFDLDDHHRLEKNRPLPVCSNTAAMLNQTRYAPHFRVEGNLSTHYGLFDCAPGGSTATQGDLEKSGICC